MVTLILRMVALSASVAFIVSYSLFFPWWRSILGRILIILGFSVSFIAIGMNSNNPTLDLIKEIGIVGSGIAMIGLISELWKTWRKSDD